MLAHTRKFESENGTTQEKAVLMLVEMKVACPHFRKMNFLHLRKVLMLVEMKVACPRTPSAAKVAVSTGSYAC